MGGSKGGGNTPPDSELRTLAIPLPELRKPVQNAIKEATQLFNRGQPGGANEWQYGPGVVQPWNSTQNEGYTRGIDAAGSLGNILNPSASLVSRVGGGEFVGGAVPGQSVFEAFARGGFNAPGQDLLNRSGSGEFVGNTPGQQTLNDLQTGSFVGRTPGQSTLNAIGAGQFATPSAGAYKELLNRALGGSGGLSLIGDTAGGKYLEGNPYLEGLISSQERDITRGYGDAVAGIEGRASAAGRLGSNTEMELQGRAQQNLGQELGDLQTRTRYQDYASERAMQQQAQLALPGAFATETGVGLNAANANAGNEWQRLQAMLTGAQAAGQGYRSDLGLQGDFANAAGNLYQNSMAQALQGAQAAGAGVRADQALQMQGAQNAAQTYQNSLAQALQGAGMAPGQAAAQLIGPDALMRYGGASQQQNERVAAENQDRFRYGQEAEWQNLQRYLGSLQGAGGLTNSNAAIAGLQGQQGGGSQLGDLATILGSGAYFASLCDHRMKADVERIGSLADGSSLYSFRYLWDEPGTVRIGPMAHEVAAINPAAAIDAGGVLMVDMRRWLH